MKIIVCVDKSNGMLFNNRRQSQDSVLREKIFSIIGEKKLFLNEYTAKQFENKDKLNICDNFLLKADSDDFCFIENVSVPIEMVNEVYLFQWNRNYPADFYFTYDLKTDFKKIKTEDFAGSSHKKITLEVYKKKALVNEK